jgi:transcriptional regulator with XRE-family HTH domain
MAIITELEPARIRGRRVAVTELARVRARHGFTQRAFARELGMHPATLSQVENKHRAAWPKLKRDAAALLGMSEEELFPSADLRPREAPPP